MSNEHLEFQQAEMRSPSAVACPSLIRTASVTTWTSVCFDKSNSKDTDGLCTFGSLCEQQNVMPFVCSVSNQCGSLQEVSRYNTCGYSCRATCQVRGRPVFNGTTTQPATRCVTVTTSILKTIQTTQTVTRCVTVETMSVGSGE